jgi:hypothetical protein
MYLNHLFILEKIVNSSLNKCIGTFFNPFIKVYKSNRCKIDYLANV